MNWLYLLLDLGTLLGPLILSFDKRVAFYTRWKALFLGIAVMMLVFIPWDILFTHYNIWGFNKDYLTGIDIVNLPLEEWLFFIVVPYACVFIYACLNHYIKKDIFQSSYRLIAIVLISILLLVAVFNVGKLYTSIACFFAAAMLSLSVVKQKKWLGRFLLAYFVSLIPFLVVNGVLTGSWIKDQVVWYNSDHILNIRIGTIPLEDTIYNLGMLLLTIYVFESKTKLKKTSTKKT